ELCRASPEIRHLVYASSSSVYGGNTKVPFAETDRVDNPVSLYAATKKADELISSTYSHLYGLPQTGLRFFTVYGPWGRPDMAAWIFTEAMLAGKPIRVFNHGEMWRDFT
ncbi:NAD-dependent epimerase/dehydratase family protein, partial [Mesorhizobium sp. M2D.F.Ca.ET.160.01.1.1]